MQNFGWNKLGDLFSIIVLSFLNAYMTWMSNEFSNAEKPVPEITAVLLHFQGVAIALAAFCLIGGVGALFFFKRAFIYVHGLVFLQLAITVYAVLGPVLVK